MSETELHVFLTAQYNLEHGSPLMMFMPCSTSGSCDPKEAKTNDFCCQVQVCLPACC